MNRLTEDEVHAACVDIASRGEKPTSLLLLDKLKRGSLSTITKYLKTWQGTDQAHAIQAESLPAVIELPGDLAKAGEELTKKIWVTAKNAADADMSIQREALAQAQKDVMIQIEEALAFSEAQSLTIERLEEQLEFTKATNTGINDQLAKLIDEHKDLERNCTGLVGEINHLKSVNADINSRIESLVIENKSLSIESATALARVADLERERSDDRKTITDLNNKIGSLRSDRDAAVGEVEKANGEIERLLEKLDKSEAELKSEIIKRSNEQADQNKSIIELVKKMDVLQERLDKSEREKNSLQYEITTLVNK